MAVGFTNRCLENASAEVMKITASMGVVSNEDCPDFTDREHVKQFLVKFAEKEFLNNQPVESSKIYGCAYKSVFVGFEDLKGFIINDKVFTSDGAYATHAAVFWVTLGY